MNERDKLIERMARAITARVGEGSTSETPGYPWVNMHGATCCRYCGFVKDDEGFTDPHWGGHFYKCVYPLSVNIVKEGLANTLDG